MKICATVLLVALCMSGSFVDAAPSVQLPAHYYKLMEAELATVDGSQLNNGAMFAAAVLYSKKHPANPFFGNPKLLQLALKLGDLQATESLENTKKDKQDNEWEIHFWLDTFRLLEKELGSERRARWAKGIETIARWFAVETEGRIDFPRYQGPYLHTSPNHYALFTSTVYMAGRVLGNKEWEALGARALHRFAKEDHTEDGFWGEFTSNGPATGYNYITMNCVALYQEHSGDKDALEALRRATTFHKYFTWPNGVPVETVDGRNRHRAISAWGHFGFSHWADGRGYAEFLASFFGGKALGSRTIGRIAQSALYYHEGPSEPAPQLVDSWAYQMKVPAGIRKTGPWMVCLSGLVDMPVDSQFTLDRQGHISIYNHKAGMIVTGANSRYQPELATFHEKTKDRVTTIPQSTRLRMADERDRLGLAYRTFFAEAEVPKPSPERLALRFNMTETSRGRVQDVALNLQLCLKEGETLETAKTKIVLSDQKIELGPEQIGGWIRHGAWKMEVDKDARLVWPILPFSPYKNAPETEMRYAVGRLTVPVKLQTPQREFNWRRGEIAFALEVKP